MTANTTMSRISTTGEQRTNLIIDITIYILMFYAKLLCFSIISIYFSLFVNNKTLIIYLKNNKENERHRSIKYLEVDDPIHPEPW